MTVQDVINLLKSYDRHSDVYVRDDHGDLRLLTVVFIEDGELVVQ
jgi:hypothetical protein